jgi:hypothetical protein
MDDVLPLVIAVAALVVLDLLALRFGRHSFDRFGTDHDRIVDVRE